MRDNALQPNQDRVTLAPYSMAQNRIDYNSNAYGAEQAYINCYPRAARDELTGELSYDVVKRPGMVAGNPTDIITTTSGTSDGMVCLANIVVTQLYDVNVAAFYNHATQRIFIVQYRPISNTSTLIGTLGNNPPGPGGTFNCSIDDKVFLTEGTTGDTLLPMVAISYQAAAQAVAGGYYAITTAGVFTAASLTYITDAQFPSNIPRVITGPFQYMNGHFYIMTLDGYIYMSSLTAAGNPDIVNWDSQATVVASQYPDRGVGVYRYKHHLLAVGQDSIEFFQDASNPPPGSTLERTDQAFIKFGAFMPKLVVNIEDTIYWVSYGSSGMTGVWKLEGYSPVKVSSQREDFMITNSMSVASGTGNRSYLTLEALELLGKKHIVFNGIATSTIASAVDQAALATASASDTYPLVATDLIGALLCYSVEDKVWWGMNSCGTTAALMVASFYPSAGTVGQYRQYCFRRTATTSGNTAITSTKPFYFELGAASTFGDANTDGTNPYPVTVLHQFNTVHLDTERMKFVRKLRVLLDPLANAPAVPALYIGVNRQNFFASTGFTQIRRISSLFTSIRYYVNQLGSGRSWSIYYIYKSIGSLRGRGVELEISQGMN